MGAFDELFILLLEMKGEIHFFKTLAAFFRIIICANGKS